MTLTLVRWEIGILVPSLELWQDFSTALINWMGRKYPRVALEIIQLLLGRFLHRMLNLGTQPPCYKDAQTSPWGETTKGDSCGEKLRLPADTASINYQTRKWMSHQRIPAPAFVFSSWGPDVRHWAETRCPPPCPVLIPTQRIREQNKWLFYATKGLEQCVTQLK